MIKYVKHFFDDFKQRAINQENIFNCLYFEYLVKNDFY